MLSGFPKIAELLIQNGADINHVGQHGRTALILAANYGKQHTFTKLQIVNCINFQKKKKTKKQCKLMC